MHRLHVLLACAPLLAGCTERNENDASGAGGQPVLTDQNSHQLTSANANDAQRPSGHEQHGESVRDANAENTSEVGSAPASQAPRIRILGTAQDGGLPHAGCACVRCTAARTDPARRRLVASLALLSPELDGAILIDATPDIHEQLESVRTVSADENANIDRAPVAGVVLTHAHIGHYLGLALFGFEAINTRGMPVWASVRMQDYLRENGPWSQLVALENIELRDAVPGRAIEVAPDIRLEPIAVPHRDEFSDTLGFYVVGPTRRVLYVPDTSPWSAWERPIADALEGTDVALLDATFYSGDELPGRDLSKIGHPLVVDSMDLLQPLVDGGLEVHFIHLNHSNPALEPGSDARRSIEARGFHVAADGQELAI